MRCIVVLCLIAALVYYTLLDSVGKMSLCLHSAVIIDRIKLHKELCTCINKLIRMCGISGEPW